MKFVNVKFSLINYLKNKHPLNYFIIISIIAIISMNSQSILFKIYLTKF